MYLPTDSPLQQVEETSNLDEQVRDRSREKVVAIKASSDSWSTKQHKEKIKQSESDMDVVMETLGAYLKRTTSRERERDDDNKSESDKGANQDDKTREAVPREMLDHSTLLHHALGRLYHTMQCQDADDYSTDHQKSNDWTVQDVKAKLESFENDIEELERREQQIVKESKQLNVTNIGILEEAYRLLGVVPPKGC